MERLTALSVYAAYAGGAGVAGTFLVSNSKRDPAQAKALGLVEHGGLWIFLFAVDDGLYLRPIMVCGGYLAADHCGGRFIDASVWPRCTGQKFFDVLFGIRRYFFAAAAQYSSRCHRKYFYALVVDFNCGGFLSAGQSEDDDFI